MKVVLIIGPGLERVAHFPTAPAVGDRIQFQSDAGVMTLVISQYRQWEFPFGQNSDPVLVVQAVDA